MEKGREHTAGGEAANIEDGGEGACRGARGETGQYVRRSRRLPNHKFAHTGVGETAARFRRRLDLVEEHLNSDAFGNDPCALLRLAKSYRARAEDLVRRRGDRLPT